MLRQPPQPLFRLRVLTHFDAKFDVYVARCLETGHVVTADSAKTADEMMSELLQEEITYAVEHQNFPNLFSSPAPFDAWTRWLELANKKAPVRSAIKVNTKEFRMDDQTEVPAEIETANA